MLAAKGVRARATALARRSPRPLARNRSTRSPNELALEQPHGSLSRDSLGMHPPDLLQRVLVAAVPAVDRHLPRAGCVAAGPDRDRLRQAADEALGPLGTASAQTFQNRELPLQQIGVSDPRRTGLTGDER